MGNHNIEMVQEDIVVKVNDVANKSGVKDVDMLDGDGEQSAIVD